MSECWNWYTAWTEAPRGVFPVRVQVPPRSPSFAKAMEWQAVYLTRAK